MMKPFLYNPSVRHLAGVDEAGRGPLAGCVVAAAVILDPDTNIFGLDDSKKLSFVKREKLFIEIQEKSLAWCIARATVEEIDAMNILQATLLAMKRAVAGLSVVPDYVAVDGNRLPDWSYASESIIKGDSLVPAISAASILAKVQRDRDMLDIDKNFPGYGFSEHKGYPTTRHLQALSELGVTVVHRRTYAPVRKILEGMQ